ncbi:hypothetical protein ACET3Z_015526 [Daucus carota]
MAISKNFPASTLLLIISFLVILQLHYSDEISMNAKAFESSPASAPAPAPIPSSPLSPKIDCGERCSERCKLSSRPNLCHRACGTCCARCNCVPPGTAGNQEVCPCYANMTTHGGRKKCP